MKKLPVITVFCAFLSIPFVFATEPIEILSINVYTSRFGSTVENAWSNRRDALMNIVNARSYDFICGQEVANNPNDAQVNQVKFMGDRLPGYGVLFRARTANANSFAEGTPVFYRKDRWAIDSEDQGTYWLSDTPDVPGSITWDDGGSGWARTVTGGLFHEKDNDGNPTGFSVYVYSTHFETYASHRIKSAPMILNRIAERKNSAIPVIIAGDFNAWENNSVISLLKGETIVYQGAEIVPQMALLDTYRVVHPDAVDVATYQGFKEHNPVDNRVDYIFVTPNLKTIDAEIIRTKRPDGGFPTDHYPIRATVSPGFPVYTTNEGR